MFGETKQFYAKKKQKILICLHLNNIVPKPNSASANRMPKCISGYGMRHRKKRHHLVGIEEVLKFWGNEAAEAAHQHIIADLKQEGWTESDPFPRDEEHYKRMGLF